VRLSDVLQYAADPENVSDEEFVECLAAWRADQRAEAAAEYRAALADAAEWEEDERLDRLTDLY
jgi:hypothetical protein